jgi:glycerophosphoryl diester phosphodiesterase
VLVGVANSVGGVSRRPDPFAALVSTHRGGGGPENTFAAFDWATARHYVSETDVQLTSDSDLCVIHDATLDRTTSGTGNVSAQTMAALRLLDSGSDYHSDYSAQRLFSLGDLLDRYPRGAFVIENKAASTAVANKIGDAITTRAMQDQCAMGLFDADLVESIAFHAAYPRIRIINYFSAVMSAPVPATVAAAGVWGVGLEWTAAWLTAQLVTDLKAAGLRVYAYTIDTRTERDAMRALGIQHFFSNFASYIVGDDLLDNTAAQSDALARTHAGDAWTSDSYGNGPFGATAYRFNNGFVGYAAVSGNSDGYVWGKMVMPSAASWKLTTTIYPRALNADTTRAAQIQFCLQQDKAIRTFSPVPAGLNGYGFKITQAGLMQLDKCVAGLTFSTLSSSAGSGAFSLGVGIPIEITVTPSSITCKRTDNNTTITSNDTTHRGGRIAPYLLATGAEFGPFTYTPL